MYYVRDLLTNTVSIFLYFKDVITHCKSDYNSLKDHIFLSSRNPVRSRFLIGTNLESLKARKVEINRRRCLYGIKFHARSEYIWFGSYHKLIRAYSLGTSTIQNRLADLISKGEQCQYEKMYTSTLKSNYPVMYLKMKPVSDINCPFVIVA